MTKIYRQGDVLLRQIDALPTRLTKKNKTLALGEITGHHHSFSNQSAVQVFQDTAGQQFADVRQNAVLEHQDHAHLQIPQGKYAVIIQREFDIVEGVRQVMD